MPRLSRAIPMTAVVIVRRRLIASTRAICANRRWARRKLPPVIRTIDYGHGRTREIRTLIATIDLTAAYLDWPDVAQVARVDRSWREQGAGKRCIHSGEA